MTGRRGDEAGAPFSGTANDTRSRTISAASSGQHCRPESSARHDFPPVGGDGELLSGRRRFAVHPGRFSEKPTRKRIPVYRVSTERMLENGARRRLGD